MVVLIKEKRIFDDGHEEIELTFRGSRKPTPSQIKKAEELDKFLIKKMIAISKELEMVGLLDKKQGSIERWYRVGKNLATIVDDPEIVAPEVKQQDNYIWVAIEQNTPIELQPNQENKERYNTLTRRNHYRLCYLVAKFPENVAKLHTWREWVEILESPSITEDNRILDWLIKTMSENPDLKLRKLAKAMRNKLKNLYTKVFSVAELESLLDGVISEALN